MDMFSKNFQSIIDKILAGYKLSIKDKIMLWAKKIGFFGMTYAIIAAISLILSPTKGGLLGLSFWELFLISFSIFATKNWEALVLLTKGYYSRFFREEELQEEVVEE